MNLNADARFLAEMLGVALDGDSFIVNSIASLERATPNDIALILPRGDGSVFDEVEHQKILASKAGIIIAQKALVFGPRYLVHKDPLAAFQKLVEFGKKQNFLHGTDRLIDQSSRIDSSAVIGNNVRIGAHSVIAQNVRIGNSVILHPNVTILEGTIIGDRSIIHSGSVIGSDGFGYSVTAQGLQKVPQIGIVRIGSDVEIGASVCIDRASFDETIIGDGVKIDNLVHIAHNVVIGAHTVIIAQSGIAGSAKIGVGCQIGGQVGIRDHVTIGDGAKIVSKSVVMKDVAPREIVCGIPAVAFSRWKRISVSLLSLPELTRFGKELQQQKEQGRKKWWRRFF